MMGSKERVIDRVLEDALGEMSYVLEEGRQAAFKAIAEAEREVQEEVNRILEGARREAGALERRILGEAEMKGRSDLLLLMEEKISEVSKKALERAKRMRKEEEYRRSLKEFIREGIEFLKAQDVVVLCNRRDGQLVRTLAKELSEEMKVKVDVGTEGLQSSGGVVIKTRDGSMSFDNTLEARLERMRPLLRKRVQEVLIAST